MLPTSQERQIGRRQWNDVAKQWKWNQAFPQIRSLKLIKVSIEESEKDVDEWNPRVDPSPLIEKNMTQQGEAKV